MTPATMTLIVRRWQRRLGLGDWTIEVEFGELSEGDPAECDADWEYSMATVRFDLQHIEPGEEEAYAVHELGHCLIAPLVACTDTLAGDDKRLQEWSRQATERVVCTLERVCLRLSPAPEPPAVPRPSTVGITTPR